MPAHNKGGFFAPQVTDQHLADWPALIAGTSGMTRTALNSLLSLVQKHRECVDHRECADLIPTAPELAQHGIYDQLFEPLSGPTRNMAFHLLWYARELQLGREPVTRDKI